METKPDAIIAYFAKPLGSTKSVLHFRCHFPTESTGFPFFGSTAYATNGYLRMEFRKVGLRSGYEKSSILLAWRTEGVIKKAS
jgi:hypothetical protein